MKNEYYIRFPHHLLIDRLEEPIELVFNDIFPYPDLFHVCPRQGVVLDGSLDLVLADGAANVSHAMPDHHGG